MSSYRASSRSWIAGLLAAGSVLLLILGPRAALSASPLRPAAQTFPAGIFLNEFMPDPNSDWNDDGAANQGDEYIELYNANAFDVDIGGWMLDDIAGGGTAPYVVPANTVLRAQRYLVLFGSDSGIGLNNAGDAVRLLTPDGSEVESYAYSSSADDEAYSKTVDGGSEWTRIYPPSPGASNQPPPPPTATLTPTTGPTATPYPAGISLNEYMPNPEADWNNDGIVGDANDEYIELYNANGFAVDLGGWQVDDVTGGGSSPYTLPPGTWIEAQAFLVLWSRDSGIALNNSGGDWARLVRPDGTEVESHFYTATPADTAYSKIANGGTEWTASYPPSPGASNQPPPATPTSTPTSTATVGPRLTPTATPTATPTETPALPPTPYPTGISLNEFMPNPTSDWNDDGILGDENDEYIELYNANDFAVDLSGWRVDDVANGGSAPYTLPSGTVIEAQGFSALWSRDTNIALNNSVGDAVRLLTPDGVEVESHSYSSNQVPADMAYSKAVDGGEEWTTAYPPSPGASNQPAAPTMTPTATATATPGVYPSGVSLNEYMPDPASDWNGDGLADLNDEYIELYNANTFAVDVSRWQLDDVAGSGSSVYRLPAGAIIPARSFLLLFRSQTGIALNNDGDWVRLLRPDGVVVEATEYSSSRNDLAYSKTSDGGVDWTTTYPPSPGASNQPAATSTPTPTATPGIYPDGVSLNEYLPDPASDWNGDGVADLNDEYIELYNANDFELDLSGWLLDDVDDGFRYGPFGDAYSTHGAIPDGSPPYALPPDTTIPARGFLLIFRGESGVALNNDGDWVRLLRPDGVVVEATEYDSSRDDQAYSKTADGGDAWTSSYPPSPGASNQPGSTPTATATPTATPGTYPAGVRLNEYLPDPATDWNGDGVADLNDEYVEIFNANDFAVNLGGWLLDDVDDGQQRFLFGPDGSPPYILPSSTTIPAGGYLLIFRSQSGVALNNEGDWVRLLHPDGLLVEATEYTASRDDEAYSKTVDGGEQWTTTFPPSPGASNQPGNTPTPTPTPTTTPTATPVVYPTGLSLNEYLPDPASDWNGDGAADLNDEYIELHNANDFAVDLGGWRLDDVDDGLRAAPDGSPPYALPPGTTIPARGFLLFFRSQTGIALNNDGDWVRLLRPDGVAVEATEYSSSRDDLAFSKTVDGGDQWTTAYLPSPGASNQTGIPPTPTPVADTVRLNELLPSPRDVDWDGNGAASYLDEWIELNNLGNEPVDLGGWMLADGQPAGHDPAGTYVLPAGAVIPPRGYLVIYRAQSGLGLDASEEWVRLLYPDGSEADAMAYDRFSGYDQSWCRLPDGAGGWTTACSETPGQANLPGSGGSGGSSGSGGAGGGGQPYDRFNHDLATIAHARGLPDGTRLTLEGQVTVLPNVFDDNEIYIQDATGGMRVYLRSAEWPPLSEGQWVRVNGRLGAFYEERQIALTRIDDIKTMQPAAPAAPLPIRTGEVAETNEGRLVQISGPITGYWKETTLYLDDGSGEARITLRPATGIRRPYVNIGEVWTVVGVASQSESGYRLLPRREADLQRSRAAAGRANGTVVSNGVQDDMAWNRAPVFLPVTGVVLTVRPPAPSNLREAWLVIR